MRYQDIDKTYLISPRSLHIDSRPHSENALNATSPYQTLSASAARARSCVSLRMTCSTYGVVAPSHDCVPMYLCV